MSTNVVSIEPRLPPALCGTSTYGWMLSQHWPEPRPRFVHLVVDGAEASRRKLRTNDIIETKQSSGCLFSAMAEHAKGGAILHYASRGYHRLGIPFWLERGVARWRAKEPGIRLLIFFHEVPQKLPLMSRHYLLEAINRGIIRRLCRAAGTVLTNTEEHAQRLQEISGRSQIAWLPVPATISPPTDFSPDFAARHPGEFVIFGLPFTQYLTVQLFERALARWKSEGLLERLHLIGPTDAKFSPRTRQLLATLGLQDRVAWHGALDPPALSAILAKAGFCLTQVTAGNYSKSTTFMAFAAHGCITVAKGEASAEPLRFLVRPEEVTGGGRPGLAQFEPRACALRDWYLRTSDWPIVATQIERLFRGT